MAKAPSKPTTKSQAPKPSRKTAPAAAAARKPKSAAAKPSVVKKAAAKPAAAKTPRAKKVAVTVKAQSTTKSGAKPKTAAKAAALKTAPKATAKTAKAGLQTKLDTVSERLIAADKKTQQNIAALETDFTALAKQMGRTKAGQTRLTRRVTELSKTLSQDLSNMQSDIRSDLAAALNNPTLDSLQAALTRAEERLGESEAAQDTAIARINHHIADIATIVESRLSDEAKTRSEAMAEMKSAMKAGQSQMMAAQAALEKTHSTQTQAMQLRFTNLQSESADAIRVIGDKVVDVAEEMGRRRDALADKLRQELSEATIAHSAEFEQFRRVVERRLEALETDFQSIDGRIDRAAAPLSSRIEGLEYGLTQAPSLAAQDYAPALQSVPPMTASMTAPTAEYQSEVSPLSAPVKSAEAVSTPPAYSNDAYNNDDAFSPPPIAPVQPVQAPQVAASPYSAQAPAEAPLELSEAAPAQAVPYDPQAYPSNAYPAHHQAAAPVVQPQDPYAQPAYAPEAYAQDPYAQDPYAQQPRPYPQNTYAPQAEAAPLDYSTAQPPFPSPENLPVMDGDLPYADPAYAEGTPPYSDDSMGAARPGAFENLKKIGRKSSGGKIKAISSSPLLTPRNLKLGGLVAALGVASFIGVQTLKKNDVPTGGEFSVASNAALDETARPTLDGTANTQILPPNERPMMSADGTPIGVNAGPKIGQEAIGQYADNRAVALTDGSETALSTAAQNGDPAAQLQLGLSQIENGELESGIALVRASANQEQPAALYRLAKLYETGQGVGKDAKTARQLTERAARGGNRIAMHDLALYFAEGRGGIEVDMPTAAKWFEKAAERGVVDSQFNLGVLFESGQGLPQDMESALMWYSIAGAQGDQMAAGRVGVLRKTLTEPQIERADKRIAAFKPSRIDEQANGIFKDVPWAKPSKVARNDADKASIIQTQTLLNEIGYAVGTADGAIGPKTKNAIMNFQRTNGLSETGVVDAELIKRLEAAADA